ncbi:flavodoxin family protein [Clostridium formicaceticum]|uniref:Flavodoxin n=1 Tax=Clostridium formicaceticum TaxID=1497 RepID=A0AAC9RR73_9CLOT|nr:flavodoxin [Clostridium formicaceticum]AOY78111.1 flavodoxin [Clostridium formicaceticum]ARE88760.1 flavodoxin [Clostridium formicaceticum]
MNHGTLDLKKLVIYYSFEGNTKLIAQTIADTVQGDLLQLVPKKEIQSKGFMKYFWGGRQVMMKKKPELYPLDKNPQDYDVLFIGTPVWAWSFAPPLYTFFQTTEIANKKVALFSCNRGQNGKTFENMKKELYKNDVVGQIEFFDPLKNNREENIRKVVDWTKGIMQAI